MRHRNGKTEKEPRTDHGPMEIPVLRDRDGVFEPQIVPKHQKEFRGFGDKILSMYAPGLTTRQIQDRLYRTAPVYLLISYGI
jgi:transposase-like protein